MKKHVLCILNASNFRRSFMAVLIFSVINLSVSGQSLNSDFIKKAEVKHIETKDNKLLFQILLDNELGEKFTVSIKDEDGNQLFKEVYSDKKFAKKFELPENEDAGKIIVMIRSLGNNQSQVFEINTTTRVYQDVVVSKIRS